MDAVKNTVDAGAARAHRIDPADDVAVALQDIAKGDSVGAGAARVSARAAIGRGHKIALKSVAAGAPVLKFGFPIGVATQDIAPGDHVHIHNLKTALANAGAYAPPATWTAAPVRDDQAAPAFEGYRRADGRVGTRNEIWVLCTVGCVANTARRVAEEANRLHAGRVDGVFAFPHPFGCSQLGDDLDGTRAVLAALASHPNAGGVLILGLGCESNQLEALLAAMPGRERERVRAFSTQDIEDELEAALADIAELVAIAGMDRREPCALSDLVIGVKCGGSDGFSGLSANPLVGRIADRVSRAGGTPILTEIPEIFGAEQLLMARCADQEAFDALGALVNGFKQYFTSHGEPVSENPSPGNIEGGITTLEEKSLGAVQKGGHAPVTEVLAYGGRASKPGLAVLEAPGNDAVSSTALVAAGATVVLFTTGRGTPLGFPAPTLKIASNSPLAARKPNWIDFDAGTVLDGEPLDAAADRLMSLVLATASGAPVRAERNGEREIAIWKRGVTL